MDDVVNQATILMLKHMPFIPHQEQPTGEEKWLSAGLKVSNAFVGRDFLSTTSDYNFKWDDSYTLPYRMWLSLDYDLERI